MADYEQTPPKTLHDAGCPHSSRYDYESTIKASIVNYYVESTTIYTEALHGAGYFPQADTTQPKQSTTALAQTDALKVDMTFTTNPATSSETPRVDSTLAGFPAHKRGLRV